MWRGGSKAFTSQHRAPKALSRCSSYYYSWLSVGGGVRWGYLAFQAIILFLCRTLSAIGPYSYLRSQGTPLPPSSGSAFAPPSGLDLGRCMWGHVGACEHSREGWVASEMSLVL